MLDTHGGASPLDDLAAGHRRRRRSTGVVAVGPRRPRQPGRPAVRRRPRARDPLDAPACGSGASPRATLHLLRASRAHAALEGRDHVLPDDVQALAVPVLAHRLMPTGETQLARRTTADVVGDLLRQVPVPPAAR